MSRAHLFAPFIVLAASMLAAARAEAEERSIYVLKPDMVWSAYVTAPRPALGTAFYAPFSGPFVGAFSIDASVGSRLNRLRLGWFGLGLGRNIESLSSQHHAVSLLAHWEYAYVLSRVSHTEPDDTARTYDHTAHRGLASIFYHDQSFAWHFAIGRDVEGVPKAVEEARGALPKVFVLLGLGFSAR